MRRARRFVELQLATFGGPGAGVRSDTAERAVPGVAETAARRLDVSLPPFSACIQLVVYERVDARQARSRRQKYQQQEERLGLDQSREHGISIAGKA